MLGGPAVVEGTLAQLPPDIRTTVGDQASVLGPRNGVLARWLQDSGRVRPAVASLGDALMQDDLAGRAPAECWAAQSPAAPYVSTVDAAAAHAWVGLPFPAALGDAPVTSVVLVGDDASGAVTGLELDAWTEVVPHPTGTAAVTANLTAPDARAPNLILLAVPPDVSRRGRRRRCCRSSTRRSSWPPVAWSISTLRDGSPACCRRSISPSSTRTISTSVAC